MQYHDIMVRGFHHYNPNATRAHRLAFLHAFADDLADGSILCTMLF